MSLFCVVSNIEAQIHLKQAEKPKQVPQVELAQTAPHSHYPLFPPGSVITPKKVITVIIQGDPYQNQLNNFGAALVVSNWYKTLAAEYRFGGNPTHHSLTVPPPTTTSKKEAEWMQYVRDQVFPTYPQANGNIYILYLLDGFIINDKEHSCGYHPIIAPQVIGVLVGRGSECDSKREPYDSPLDHLTATASHEALEGITDNAHPGWHLHVTNNVYDVSPWASSHGTGNIELADMCGGTRIKEGSFTYERIYSNQQVPGNLDPCKPARVAPGFGGHFSNWFYGSSTPVVNDTQGPWYSIAFPTTSSITKEIEVTGWSSGKMDDWYLQAKRCQCGDDAGNIQAGDTNAKAHFTSTPSLSGTPVTVGSDVYYKINNGQKQTLTITATAGVSHKAWCLYTLYNVRLDSTTNKPYESDDFYHKWIIGVWVP